MRFMSADGHVWTLIVCSPFVLYHLPLFVCAFRQMKTPSPTAAPTISSISRYNLPAAPDGFIDRVIAPPVSVPPGIWPVTQTLDTLSGQAGHRRPPEAAVELRDGVFPCYITNSNGWAGDKAKAVAALRQNLRAIGGVAIAHPSPTLVNGRSRPQQPVNNLGVAGCCSVTCCCVMPGCSRATAVG